MTKAKTIVLLIQFDRWVTKDSTVQVSLIKERPSLWEMGNFYHDPLANSLFKAFAGGFLARKGK